MVNHENFNDNDGHGDDNYEDVDDGYDFESLRARNEPVVADNVDFITDKASLLKHLLMQLRRLWEN